MTQQSEIIGPILLLDDLSNGKMHLAALFIAPQGSVLSPITAPDGAAPVVPLTRFGGAEIHRARFALPSDRNDSYTWQGTRYDVASDLGGDLRIGYSSCNGEEHDDLARDPTERNAMWARLCEMHRATPLSLLLHGGDQVYADEATLGHKLSHEWPEELPRDPSQADLTDLRVHLEARFAERYLSLYAAPELAYLKARIPSLMQWDDHDICDGWGSLQRSRTYSPVGQVLFSVAREAALIFQHGCIDGDLPARFADPDGLHLGWQVALPGLRLLGPDLRGERTRREVMGPGGWRMIEEAAATPAPGRSFLMSSIPLLGPRLSLLEGMMLLIPHMQKYEDDLRDQWQSRAHRGSWLRMLRIACQMAEADGQDLTVLSGEIHLATRAEMGLRDKVLHQLVASGISHRPPPRAWAHALGILASLGESPLPGHPIAIRRIPGQTSRYVAERNALILTRCNTDWAAQWLFEEAGLSDPLVI